MIVTPDQVCKKDILIIGDKIREVNDNILPREIFHGCKIIDASGKFVIPGIIDAHTHYFMKSSSNQITADDFYSGSISAAFGGVTTFIDYAEQQRGHTIKEAFANRQKEAKGKAVVDYSLHQSVCSLYPNLKKDLEELKTEGVNSLKLFTTYKEDGSMLDKESWLDLLRMSRDLKLLITVHAEDDEMIDQNKTKYKEKGELPPYFHTQLRPPEIEYEAIKKVGNMAKSLDMPIYIVHLSSEKGYKALKEIRKSRGKIFAETAPHYLLLTEDLLKGKDAQKYFMTPPLRKKEDNLALWRAIENNDIEVIASDHCSYTIEQKLSSSNCLNILSGIPGSETLLPLVYSYGVRRGYFDIKRMVNLLSTNPAKIFGLYPEKGSLKVGTDADLVIFDPEKEIIISDSMQHTAAGYTPFDGFKVKGYPIATILRGKVIVNENRFYGEQGGGKFLKGKESVLY
ncbi:MAG: Dihydropyrimidinase [candidate division TA06 bacterium 34_109]|uniref:D-hydantoinase n=1 Tax=candidate division TA06 bacterium 34_109 TaxID=1635277 RepID=A0A117M612_UNCT6|nr:MAG: Dihydropyrimidinase [candidate division TA06 bacterium 34_109]